MRVSGWLHPSTDPDMATAKLVLESYDAEPIRQHSRSLGHVPLIDTNPRRDKTLAEELRTEARAVLNRWVSGLNDQLMNGEIRGRGCGRRRGDQPDT